MKLSRYPVLIEETCPECGASTQINYRGSEVDVTCKCGFSIYHKFAEAWNEEKQRFEQNEYGLGLQKLFDDYGFAVVKRDGDVCIVELNKPN